MKPARRRVADFTAKEVAAAVGLSLGVLLGAGCALKASGLDRPAAAPEIDKGTALPVKVIPVLDIDAPLLKLGGKRDAAKLPDRWVRQAPKPRAERRAHASAKAGKTEKDIPPPDVAMADAGAPPPPPTAELARQVDTPLPPVPDAGPPANVTAEGHQDGTKEGTEADPLKARAVDLYRARIIAWFSSRFRVNGSGLSAEELGKLRGRAGVQLSADRRVTGYTLAPSGNAAFDAAARATLEAAKGDQIPPPPENYPDVVQTQINLTFVCKEGRCD